MPQVKPATSSKPLVRRFCDSRTGNVSMLFGLSVVTLFSFTGGAIDYARWFSAKNRTQIAMDSAALAGGRALQLSPTNDTSVAIAAAQAYFNQMKPTNVTISSASFTVIENSTVLKGQVTFSINTYFLGVAGFNSLQSNLLTEAVLSANGNAGSSLELSIMLDTTGSMDGQKIIDLKDAAKDMIDIVVWDDQSEYYSKVALAPFSQRVNVGGYLDKVTTVQATKDFSGEEKKGRTCVTERTGDDAYTDEKPTGDRMNAYSGDVGNAAKENENNYSNSGKCRTSNGVEIPEIVPLSSDKAALKAHIDTLPADGSTAGALGTAWAWYLLSPKWTGIWPHDSVGAPYSHLTELSPMGTPKLIKVAVLMSDGIFNTFGGQSADEATVSAHAVAVCNAMKAQGIKVYTIGFQLGGSQMAVDTLKACATRLDSDPADAPSYFFSASSGVELKAAFRQIALQLSTLRIRS